MYHTFSNYLMLVIDNGCFLFWLKIFSFRTIINADDKPNDRSIYKKAFNKSAFLLIGYML